MGLPIAQSCGCTAVVVVVVVLAAAVQQQMLCRLQCFRPAGMPTSLVEGQVGTVLTTWSCCYATNAAYKRMFRERNWQSCHAHLTQHAVLMLCAWP